MPAQPRRVVILYSHPLLGEGLARLLCADDHLRVELVRIEEPPDADQALAGCPGPDCPDVVILERGVAIQPIDVLAMVPTALLIDVGLDAGPSWAIRREQLSPQAGEILRTIRSGRRPARRRQTAIPIEPDLEVPAQS